MRAAVFAGTFLCWHVPSPTARTNIHHRWVGQRRLSVSARASFSQLAIIKRVYDDGRCAHLVARQLITLIG